MKRYPSIILLAVAGAAAAETETLSPVVVTATRTERTADQSLASVTVITREMIEKEQRLSIQDALHGIAGIGVVNTGGLGKPSTVFMRGTNSDHVLVLVDGVRMGSPTLGTTQFQDIPIDQVERIEIVRGPRSSLYGSEAIGGVIQIFTRKGGGNLKPFLSLGLGSYDTYKATGGVSGGGERGWFNLSGSAIYTGGINACAGMPFPPGGGCFTYEPDRDGYSNISGSARAGYRFENGVEVEANLLHAGGENRYDGDFVNFSRIVQQVIGGKLKFSPMQRWDVTLRAGSNMDDSDNFLRKVFVNRFNTTRVNASLQNDFTLAENHLLTAGFDYYIDQVDSTEDYSATSRDDKAGFLQYQGDIAGHSLDLSVRHDENQQFGGRTTGSAAWGYRFGEALRLTASYGTAFKAPTFNALYFPGFGNPDLQPETSQSVEVGFNGTLAEVNWAINGYYTQIDDLIAFDATTYRSANIAKAEILGMENRLSTRILGVDVSAQLTLLDPRNLEDGPNDGNQLPRRAQQMFRLDLDRAFGPFRVGLTIHEEGRRYDDLANQTRLNGFTLLDLRAGYEVFRDVVIEARASNLSNAHYQTAYLYNQLGTNLFLSVNYRPSGT